MFTLSLQSGPAVLAVERLTVDGAVLRLSEAVAAGRWVAAELRHPSIGQPLTVAAKVTWSQPIAPGLALSLTAVDFVGTWEALGSVRRAILGAQGSRAYAGDAMAGHVVVEPGGTWACHGPETVKVAVVARDEGRFSVRRRDAREPATASTFAEAIARAFGLPTAPRLDPAIEPSEAPRSGSHARPTGRPAPAPSPAPAPAEDEEAVLAARTLLIEPDEPPTSGDDGDEEALLAAATDAGEPVDEAAVLAARTMVVVDRPPASLDDHAVLAARTVVLGREAPPRDGQGDRRWSKVLDGGRLVGWIAPDTEQAWSIYDDRGRKTAIVASVEGTVRVCWLGDKATESFEFFEAPTALEAIAVAYELTGPPKIEPPLAGL